MLVFFSIGYEKKAPPSPPGLPLLFSFFFRDECLRRSSFLQFCSIYKSRIAPVSTTCVAIQVRTDRTFTDSPVDSETGR
jgi:hypothetical protein